MAKKRDKDRKGTQNGVVGRPSVFPGKRRDKPVQVALTTEGLNALDRGIERTGYSKANYIEKLLRDEDARQERRAARAS